MISRRKFLKRSGKAAGASIALGGFLARAYSQSTTVGPMGATALSDTDRVLVIIRLGGGNDGLNTLIPHENEAYHRARPTLGISSSDARVNSLNETHGLHPSLTGFKHLHDEGRLLSIQGVGYPNPDRSHFRSTDIWMSGSDSNEFLSTGWLGRFLDEVYPDFPNTLPDHPLAIDIGPVLSMSLIGKSGGMGIALKDPREFFSLVNLGNQIIDTNEIPTPSGFELDFVRQVNRESIQYSDELKKAGEQGVNKIRYPDTKLGGQLALIARLIDGGMKSRVYLVSQRGYDTHSNQLERHANLMTDLNDATIAFHHDLTAQGNADRVLGMTVSEFGRRVEENGSAGTDHGTSAPVFIFGPDLQAGLMGPDPDFRNVDNRGDFFHTYDFRQVYASVLNQWFEIPKIVTDAILPSATSLIPIIRPIQTDASDFNNDGIVDFADFLEFADGFQRGDTRFDIDGNGQTGFSDFLEFARAFGRRRST
jgi:uncharacterized protein (DUF1501 family)